MRKEEGRGGGEGGRWGGGGWRGRWGGREGGVPRNLSDTGKEGGIRRKRNVSLTLKATAEITFTQSLKNSNHMQRC